MPQMEIENNLESDKAKYTDVLIFMVFPPLPHSLISIELSINIYVPVVGTL